MTSERIVRHPALLSPRDAGRMADVFRCPGCGKVLGERHTSGGYLLCHEGRRVHAPAITMIHCEDCGAEFSPETEKVLNHAA